MRNLPILLHNIGLVVALTMTLPVTAEERDPQAKATDAITRPATSKASPKPLDNDVLQGLEAPAAGPAPKQQGTAEVPNLPYVTFDGASNSN